MNNQSVSEQVMKLEKSVSFYALFCKEQVTTIEQDTESQIQDFQTRVKVRVGGVESLIVLHVSNLYLDTEHHYALFWFHASPGFAEWSCSFMPKLLSIFHWIGVQILTFVFPATSIIMDVVEGLYPDYKAAMDEIENKVAEFSSAIGFGVDGLSHLVQATQSGISVLGGVLGKSDDWMEFEFLDKSLKATQRISEYATELQTDPSGALARIFRLETDPIKDGIFDWWLTTNLTLKTASENAIKAVKGVGNVVNDLQKFGNAMPAFIRDNIPQAIWDGLDNADNLINDNILPKFTIINRTLSEYSAAIEAQRNKAALLANKLALPGDLLLGLDKFTGESKRVQQLKIDDVVSRQYNEDTEIYKIPDAVLIAELDRTSALFEAGIPPLTFMSLEDAIPGTNPAIVKEPFETWFVGGYKSQY